MLADPTRLRLLNLVEAEELTVAELAAATRLAQPRISTHLARLREGGLVRARRDGTSVYYRANGEADGPLAELWQRLIERAEDPLLRADRRRLPDVLRARAMTRGWADAVAGDMERHYSPGRTWEATARALVPMLELRDVLDIASGDGALDELIAPRARSLTCLDISHTVMHAGMERLAGSDRARFCQATMEALPFPDASFDQVLLLHALTYTREAGRAFSEASRVLRPGGTLLGATLKRHAYGRQVAPFGHVNRGFTTVELEKHMREAGLAVRTCGVTSRERRAPHFEVITFTGTKA